jgi:F-type H+-transporting ATPase subunit b
MDIFNQIGINTTAITQFVFYAIALFVLSKFVFAPYAYALEEREKRTKGGEDLALEFQKKSIELHTEYELKARRQSEQIKAIFDAIKASASAQYEMSVTSTRDEANLLVVENRNKISSAISSAAAELRGQTTAVAMAIANKLLGK